MSSLMPLYLGASLCLGTAALALLLAAALRSGRRELRHFLAFFTALCLLDASNLVLFSLASQAGAGAGGISPPMFALIVVDKCLTLGLSLSASLMAQAILDVPWRRLGTLVACAVSALGLLPGVLPPLMAYDAAARAVRFGSALDPGTVASALNIAYALGSLLVFRSRIPEARVRRLALGFFLLSASFTPLLAGDFLALKDSPVLAGLDRLSAFFPLYLVALSAVVIALALPYLAGPREAAATTSAPAATPSLPPKELAERHELTSREGEIVGLILRGRSNKEIAWELGISARTVGNHIYSLYRKIGINSRFELMGLLPRVP
jgi:DNA-binding CsgD family transcriptional regulator